MYSSKNDEPEMKKCVPDPNKTPFHLHLKVPIFDKKKHSGRRILHSFN